VRIDLNCDMGEGFGRYDIGQDAEAMPLISSANVACGFHASDPGTMHRTVRLAKEHGVAVGAHPSFPDRVGFGRREMSASPAEIRDDVMYQVGALLAFCKAEGIPLRHVKPHGALFHLVMHDDDAADGFVRAAAATDQGRCLVGHGGSALERAAARAGIRFVREAYMDRHYEADGSLTSRERPDALITDPSHAAAQAMNIVVHGRIRVRDRSRELSVQAETLCVHSDTPGAPEIARAVRAALEGAGVQVAAF